MRERVPSSVPGPPLLLTLMWVPLGPGAAARQAEARDQAGEPPTLRATPRRDRGDELLRRRSQIWRLRQRRPQVGQVLRAGTGGGRGGLLRRGFRPAAARGPSGGGEAEGAAAEGERAGAEPGPAEGEAAEHVGQPVDVEQDPAGRDRHCDADRDAGEGWPGPPSPPAAGDEGEGGPGGGGGRGVAAGEGGA